MSDKPQIGLLEDDDDLSQLLSLWLDEAGYGVRVYPNAAEFRRKQGATSADLLILDWNLPGESGLSILRSLREADSQIPVLFLTARDTQQDIVAGLRAGADDYVSKPASQGELLARVAALLRRTQPRAEAAELDGVEPYVIDLNRRRFELEGSEVVLTEREFDLALFLFRRHGRVVSREMLLESIWNIRGDVATRTVDTHISRLRKKLSLDGAHGWRLNGVYQHGYRLERA
ncbi:MAG TPA: response regulator transcription factor [Chiayiivirga sp.]|nr:response regulator transcription factor [Chiayiivirga sp.]